MELNQLIKKANTIFLDNFPAETCFERGLFFSWYCSTGDCKFCFMSTQQDKIRSNKSAVRSEASLIAETILCKKLGWDLGFFAGGHDAYTNIRFKEILEKISQVWEDKVWVNVGPLKRQELEQFAPHTRGVVASIEILNKELHNKICPSKPVGPFIEMFNNAEKLGLEKAMTIILGLGEKIEEFDLLKEFIKEHKIKKIHIYSLNAQKGTIFENSPQPTVEYQAEWIAKTRIAFPKMDIQCGIWKNRVDATSLLLKAGANSISKFPALKYFGSEQAKSIEGQAKIAERKFKGTLTDIPDIDCDSETDKLDFEEPLRLKINKKLKEYMGLISRNNQ